jgi:hypothetical protein
MRPDTDDLDEEIRGHLARASRSASIAAKTRSRRGSPR